MLKAHIRPPSETNESYEELIKGSLYALELEIAAIKKAVAAWGGDKPALATAGIFEKQYGDLYYYRVTVRSAVYPPDWTAIEVLSTKGENQARTKGNVLKTENKGKTLYIATEGAIEFDEFAPPQIGFDATYVLEMTAEKLRNPLPNTKMVMKALGVSSFSVQDALITHPTFDERGMNEGQKAAGSRVSGSEIAFVFGPPGTGKTSLLGCIVADMAESQGKRVLITAHTNTALDTALASVCKSLPHLISESQILRKGSLSKEFVHLNISEKVIKGKSSYNGRPLIVGATLSQLAIIDPADLGFFDVVMIDENSMANVPQVAIAASYAKSQVIGLGDPRQLPPVVQSEVPAAKQYLKRNAFSLLDIEDPAIDIPYRPILTEQYRMSPPICALVSQLFYAGRLTNAREVEGRTISGTELVLLDTSDLGLLSKRSGSSRINEGHARLVAELVQKLTAQHKTNIGIINPFAAQGNVIRESIMENNRSFFRAGGQIGTIHRSQGGERDIIILDTVDAGPRENMSSFLDGSWNEDLSQLLCVGLSRARKQLLIIANTKSFRQKYGKGDSLIMNILEQSYRIGKYIKPSAEEINTALTEMAGQKQYKISV